MGSRRRAWVPWHYLLVSLFLTGLLGVTGAAAGLVRAASLGYLRSGWFALAYFEAARNVPPALVLGGLFAFAYAALLVLFSRQRASAVLRSSGALVLLALSLGGALGAAVAVLHRREVHGLAVLWGDDLPTQLAFLFAYLRDTILSGRDVPRPVRTAVLAAAAVVALAAVSYGISLAWARPPRVGLYERQKALLSSRTLRRLAFTASALWAADLFLVLAPLPPLRPPPGRGTPPDLLLISIDTLRADQLGLYGYGRDTSPHLDRLAAESVVFEDVVAPAPWTLPSHVSMLTGQETLTHQVDLWQRISVKDRLLAEVLKNRGWATAAIVSNINMHPRFGFERGFERYSFLEDRPAGELVDRVIAEIRRLGRPYFFFLHLNDPHDPYWPPEGRDAFGTTTAADRYVDLPPDEETPGDFAAWALSLDAAGQARQRDLYDAEIRYADRELGRLFEFLRGSGRWDHTLVVVTSDHGEELTDHGAWGHGFRFYQESLRVPLIVKPVRAVGEFSRPGRVTKTVGLIDLAPTLLDLLGYSFPGPVDGRSFAAVFRGGMPEDWEETYLSTAMYRSLELVCYRAGRWKYSAQAVIGPAHGARYALAEILFDLARDPAEWENLAAALPDRRAAMAAELTRRVGPRRLEVLGTPDTPAGMRERLRALGYLR